jgi:hypothetical protein
MHDPKPLRLIPMPVEPIPAEQAAVLLGRYRDDAGELAAGVALTLRGKGCGIRTRKVHSAVELIRTWSPGASGAIIALTHYQPWQITPFDAV